MARLLEIKGANPADIEERSKAFDALNELPTVVLKNMASISHSKKAQSYFSNPISFALVKGFLNK